MSNPNDKKDENPLKGKIGLRIKAQVHDEHGKLVYENTQEGHSFVQNFSRMLYDYFVNNNTVLTLTDPANNIHTLRSSTAGEMSTPNFGAASGNDLAGIVVGSGNNATFANDVGLQIHINHGSGANQLNYGAMSPVQPSISGNQTTQQFSRQFSNVSGSPIQVTEVAMYATMIDTLNNPFTACQIKDTLGSSINIPNNNTLTITYQIFTIT